MLRGPPSKSAAATSPDPGKHVELRRKPTAIESLMDLAREGSGRHALDVWASA